MLSIFGHDGWWKENIGITTVHQLAMRERISPALSAFQRDKEKERIEYTREGSKTGGTV